MDWSFTRSRNFRVGLGVLLTLAIYVASFWPELRTLVSLDATMSLAG